MRVIKKKIVENLYLLRLDDNKTKYFEAIWSIPEGVTYNSYVLITDEGSILFDSWKHSFSELFIENLKEIVDLRDITHIVIHHMEQDHSGSLPTLVKLLRLGHLLTQKMFKAFYGLDTDFIPVKDKETFRIGGKELKFIHTPWLHWPETIMSFLLIK